MSTESKVKTYVTILIIKIKSLHSDEIATIRGKKANVQINTTKKTVNFRKLVSIGNKNLAITNRPRVSCAHN